MIDIKSRLDTINHLLSEGTKRSLTYAALECRLTIEQICYERLIISYDYISYDDLKNWQPAKVIAQIANEANDDVVNTFTVSISTTPLTKGSDLNTKEDYEALTYVPVGTQVGLNFKKLGKLWNALSNVALHVSFPQQKNDQISIYGDIDSIKLKVIETIEELKNFETNSLITSGFGKEYHFECIGCGILLKRKLDLLRSGQIINCVSQLCNESYVIHIEDNQISHGRRVYETPCNKCNSIIQIPHKQLELLHIGQSLHIDCKFCKTPSHIELIPCKRNT